MARNRGSPDEIKLYLAGKQELSAAALSESDGMKYANAEIDYEPTFMRSDSPVLQFDYSAVVNWEIN
jgi:hypothetical protein